MMCISGGDSMYEQFINEHFLKKNEQIDEVHIEGSFAVITVIKKTARTLKKIAQFKVTTNGYDKQPIPQQLLKYRFSSSVKRQLTERPEYIQQWLLEGWIVRELRYNDDGVSLGEACYRMGPSYVAALQLKERQNDEAYNEQQVQLLEKAQQLQLPPIFQQAIAWDKLPRKWSTKKRFKYIEFCLAFYELSQKKDLFDYKEIGATLFDTIGGSKYFDAERESFLSQLLDSGIDASYYGLVSIGKIVPIYFTGNVQNAYSSYALGAVHATTDNAVLLAPFTTTNTTLWLVENRAILTRMAVEFEFLQRTNSCVVCLDGQIRSAHQAFIEQLQQQIEKTVIWTDTDAAGINIAKHAAQLINGTVSFVGRHFTLYDSIEQFAQAHENKPHEQEQQLGGVEQWMKWV